MQKTKLILTIVISLLFLCNIFLAGQLYLSKAELKDTQQLVRVQDVNTKALFFAKLFVNKILMEKGTVSFEDRLKLENAVRDINDKEILNQWQKFVDSKGGDDSQICVGNLLELLLLKVSK